MVTTFTPPWGLSGYGDVDPAAIRIASFEETESIWYTPTTYDDPEDAVEGAAENAEAFMMAGHVLTGVGMEPISIDLETREATFRGYITFAGPGPAGAMPVMGKSEKPPWWHYGLAAGGGVVGGIIIGALVGSLAR